MFTEGPLWHPDGSLLFVDIRRSQIFKLVLGGEPEVIRENSGESNGMTFDSQGRVVICESMKVDVEGRVYCTGPGGCWVFDPSGELLGIIRLPEYPANCAWGGPDNQTMFFTANTSIYSLRMKTPGTMIPRA